MRTPRDALPGTRVAGAAAYALGERYRDLDRHLAGADIVHARRDRHVVRRTGRRVARAHGLRARSHGVGDDRLALDLPLAARARLSHARAGAPATASCPPPSAPATRSCSRASPPSASPSPRRASTSTTSPPPPPPRSRPPSTGSCRPGAWCGRRAIRTCCAPSPPCAASWPGPRTPTSNCSSSATAPSASAWSATRASSASPAASSSATPSPTTTCPRSTRRPRRWCSRACPRAGGRSSSAWSSSRPSPPARRSSRARRARSPRSSAADGTLVAAGDWLGIAQALGDAVAGAPAARTEVDRARLERFSSAAAAERLRAVYAELLETGAPRSARRRRRGSRHAQQPGTAAGPRTAQAPGTGRWPG